MGPIDRREESFPAGEEGGDTLRLPWDELVLFRIIPQMKGYHIGLLGTNSEIPRNYRNAWVASNYPGFFLPKWPIYANLHPTFRSAALE